MSNETLAQCSHAPNPYTSEDVARYLYPDTPQTRKELEAVADLAARFVDAWRMERRTFRAIFFGLTSGSSSYWTAREMLAEVRLALRDHRVNVGPRALRAVAAYLQLRVNADAPPSAESQLLAELEELEEMGEREDLRSGPGRRRPFA